MRILVVCGAGASSTFVAQRLNSAARARRLPYLAIATNEVALAEDVASSDLVLAGPHLAARLPHIEALAAPHGVGVVLMDMESFSDLDGIKAVALVEDALHDLTTPTDTLKRPSGRTAKGNQA